MATPDTAERRTIATNTFIREMNMSSRFVNMAVGDSCSLPCMGGRSPDPSVLVVSNIVPFPMDIVSDGEFTLFDAALFDSILIFPASIVAIFCVVRKKIRMEVEFLDILCGTPALVEYLVC